MADTLTIRVSPEARSILQETASARGMGLSAYVRALVEEEARRQEQARVRPELDSVVAYLRTSPRARSELEALGTPQSDVP
ncbi:MAG: DUF1778 domain-containing protein [Candidatus Dormiibacterota bacterium]